MAYKNFLVAFILLLLGIGVALLLLERLFAWKRGLNEPPTCPQRIPFVGHMLGLLMHGTPYLKITR